MAEQTTTGRVTLLEARTQELASDIREVKHALFGGGREGLRDITLRLCERFEAHLGAHAVQEGNDVQRRQDLMTVRHFWIGLAVMGFLQILVLAATVYISTNP